MYLNTFSKYFSDIIVEHFQQLNEFKMSPTSLLSQVNNIQAVCGIEFEFFIPDLPDEDQQYLYVEDEKANSIQDIIDFFYNNDIHDTRGRYENALRQDFFDWCLDKFPRDWFDKHINVSHEAKKEAKRIASEMEQEGEDYDESYETAYDETVERLTDEAWEEQGDIFNNLMEEWSLETDSEYNWLDDKFNCSIEAACKELLPSLEWPMKEVDNNDDQYVVECADSFSRAVGRQVHVDLSNRGTRIPGQYTMERDGSVNSNSNIAGAGIEFVSPVLTIPEMIEDLKKVIQWAKSYGCITNKTTGLHMNISLKNTPTNQIDYVKLVLLLGDDYITDSFGRYMNTYCSSSLNQISRNITPVKAKQMFDQMKNNLNHQASKLIHNGITDKYVSVNTANRNRIEFRGPGNDYLNMTLDSLITTLLRCVVALDAASDPNKHRKEYLTKLYKTLQINTNDQDDPLALFVDYSASRNYHWKIPESGLKNILKKRALERDSQPKKQTKLANI